MNIAIFVTSLAPHGASQARFQGALLAGLQKLSNPAYRFIILTHDVPSGYQSNRRFSYFRIDQYSRWKETALALKVGSGKALQLVIAVLGLNRTRLSGWASRLLRFELAYYKQLRILNVRLVWNMNQHELATDLPYIRTIWDVNHRLMPMYPEYSYSRYTFQGLEGNMTQSLARASYVIVGTHEGKNQLVQMYGVHESKVRVIPFPTPTLPNDAASPIALSVSEIPYVYYPARLWPHKNHVVVLAAVSLLKISNIHIKCVFSGADEGNLGYLLQCAQDLGISDRMQYVGKVPDEALAPLYKGALSLVYASTVGPDNLPPLEAMSFECPVITADIPGAREQYGDAALYFDPMSERELAVRIRELIEDQGTRERLIQNGRKRAASWSPEDYAREVVSLIDEFALRARAWERCDSKFT